MTTDGGAKKALKVILGFVLVIIGLAALVLPLVPFGWLIFVGFQLLGLKALFWVKLKAWFQKREERSQ